jgi:hypothetical protein
MVVLRPASGTTEIVLSCGCEFAFAVGCLVGMGVLFLVLLTMGASDTDPDEWD